MLQHVADDVLAHAREEMPRECCGLLLGKGGWILRNVRARNLEAGTTRFLIDPHDHIRALRDARAAGLELVGFYHSHPRSAAYPSESDLKESVYPGSVHLIAGVSDGLPHLRLFSLDGGVVTELALCLAASTEPARADAGGS